MSKYPMLAIHRIHRAVEPGSKATISEPAKAPKMEFVKPGFVFEANSAAERTELSDMGAARVLSAQEAKAAVVGERLLVVSAGVGAHTDSEVNTAVVPPESASTAGGKAKAARSAARKPSTEPSQVTGGNNSNPAPEGGGEGGGSGSANEGDGEDLV